MCLLRSVPASWYAALACIVVLAVIIPSAIAHNAAAAAEAAKQEAAKEKAATKAEVKTASESEQLEDLQFDLTAASFDEMPTDDGLRLFSLSGLKSPTIASDDFASVEQAIDAIEEQGSASVVFIDVETGRGISYQPIW